MIRPISQQIIKHSYPLTTHIAQRERTAIERVFSKVIHSPYIATHFDFLSVKAEEVLRRNLTDRTIQHILDVNTTNKGFVEITGVPNDPFTPDTPVAEGDVERTKKTYVKELFCMGLARLMGQEIFNYRQEAWGTGSLIFNIFPREALKSVRGAGGYQDDFRFHSENAWHTQFISTLFLTGVRSDHEKQAITYCIGNQTVVDHLTEGERKILQEHSVRIMPPEIHFKMEQEERILFTAKEFFIGPVMTYDSQGFVNFRINFNGMRTEKQDLILETALNRLEDIAKAYATEIRLDHQNMVVVNNQRAMHTRNGYKPKFDGQDRWFQRYYLTDEKVLWRSILIKPHDFLDLLFFDQANELYDHLKRVGILDATGKLTSKFTPHEAGFDLELPSKFEGYKTQLLKILIGKGPARPHRVV